MIDNSGFVPGSERFVGATIELRDVSTNEEWARAYAMSVPVLMRLLPGGQEQPIPRAPPKTSVDRLRRHLEANL